ncbi:hypothetical protein F3J34_30455 [Klebsiella sp. Ap-873]|nr:hypothetical protein [Klebsiella sp. Ap-873]
MECFEIDGKRMEMASDATLRDYFAAKAMQGWLASYGPDDSHPVKNDYEHQVASMSYKMADAMLKARSAHN